MYFCFIGLLKSKKMKIKDVITELERMIPLQYAEDFDNVGLLVGEENTEVTGVLITHDTLEEVVEEAVSKNLNLIISFHPIIFKGLKSLTGKTYVERTVMKAIRHKVAVYAIHTALDNRHFGVSGILANHLGLLNQKILIPQPKTLRQLVTYAPEKDAETVRNALFSAGAGQIGKYAECSFNVLGTGTFKALEGAEPYVGKIGERHREKEERISVIFPKHLQNQILQKLFEAHPYEEVAYEILELLNNNEETGLGIIGDLPEEKDEKNYLYELKKSLQLDCIRYSGFRNKPIRRVAVLGGSGSFAIEAAKAAEADIFISADIKYHEFYQSENQMIIADVGHFESEQFTKLFLFEQLTKKFRNFAVALSEINTNPVNYL
jgi:dinuclear metal center YbgI/SA1388 family protein